VIPLTALIILLAIVRCFIGVDLYDESYWLAFQWRFALGDRPFIDEVSFHQNFAVFTFPLVWIFHWLRGNSDGLVLYSRAMFLMFAATSSVATWALVRKHFSIYQAWIAAVLVFLAPTIPFNFSYGSLGLYGFALGTLILFSQIHTVHTAMMVAAAALHGIGMASDPTQIPGCLAAFGIFCVLGGYSRRNVLSYTLTGGAIAASMLIYAGVDGLTNIWESRIDLLHSEFSVRFFEHLYDLLAVPGRWSYISGLLIFAAVFHFGFKRLQALSLLCLPILAGLIVFSMGYGSRFFFAYFGLAGLFFVPTLKGDSLATRCFAMLWIPSVIAAISFTWGGNIGGVARFGGGMTLACVATAILLIRSIEKLNITERFFLRIAPVVICIPLIATTAFTIFDHWSLEAKQARVSDGPFWGIYTDVEKAEWIQEVLIAVRNVERNHVRVLFHPHFPAGYIFTAMKPASNNVWWTVSYSKETAGRYLEGFRRYTKEPTLAVGVDRLFYNPFEVRVGASRDEVGFDQIGPFLATMHQIHRAPTFSIYSTETPGNPKVHIKTLELNPSSS
jgi:hypothetical protein